MSWIDEKILNTHFDDIFTSPDFLKGELLSEIKWEHLIGFKKWALAYEATAEDSGQIFHYEMLNAAVEDLNPTLEEGEEETEESKQGSSATSISVIDRQGVQKVSNCWPFLLITFMISSWLISRAYRMQIRKCKISLRQE